MDHQLRIVPSTPQDKRKAYAWLCQSETTKSHMGPPDFEDHPIPSWEEYCADFEDWYFDGSQPEKGQLWMITLGNEPIGAVCYSSFHLRNTGAELDIWMATDAHCGKGFGSEAIRLLCDHLQNHLGIGQFIIRPSERNARAVRAYEKAGFVRVPKDEKQLVVQEFLLEEYWDAYGQGDYGNGDDVVLVK